MRKGAIQLPLFIVGLVLILLLAGLLIFAFSKAQAGTTRQLAEFTSFAADYKSCVAVGEAAEARGQPLRDFDNDNAPDKCDWCPNHRQDLTDPDGLPDVDTEGFKGGCDKFVDDSTKAECAFGENKIRKKCKCQFSFVPGTDDGFVKNTDRCITRSEAKVGDVFQLGIDLFKQGKFRAAQKEFRINIQQAELLNKELPELLETITQVTNAMILIEEKQDISSLADIVTTIAEKQSIPQQDFPNEVDLDKYVIALANFIEGVSSFETSQFERSLDAFAKMDEITNTLAESDAKTTLTRLSSESKKVFIDSLKEINEVTTNFNERRLSKITSAYKQGSKIIFTMPQPADISKESKLAKAAYEREGQSTPLRARALEIAMVEHHFKRMQAFCETRDCVDIELVFLALKENPTRKVPVPPISPAE